IRPGGLVQDVPRALDEVVLAALHPEPERRPDSANTLRNMLAEAVPGALKIEPSVLAELVSLVVPDEAGAEGGGGARGAGGGGGGGVGGARERDEGRRFRAPPDACEPRDHELHRLHGRGADPPDDVARRTCVSGRAALDRGAETDERAAPAACGLRRRLRGH